MRCFDATLGVPLRNHYLAGRGCPIRPGQGFETLASSTRKAITSSTTVTIEGQLLCYYLKHWLIYVTADQNKH